MAWAALIFSAVFEAVWATALGQSQGFTQPVPTVVFIAALLVSFVGLAYAAKHIPMGTGYAIWTGTGAALTVAYAMLTGAGAEDSSPLKIIFLTGIIGSVVGFKVVGSKRRPATVLARSQDTGQKSPAFSDSDALATRTRQE